MNRPEMSFRSHKDPLSTACKIGKGKTLACYRKSLSFFKEHKLQQKPVNGGSDFTTAIDP